MKDDQRVDIALREEAEVEPSGDALLKLAGGAVLALLAWAVISSLPDIKRYIKISTM